MGKIVPLRIAFVADAFPLLSQSFVINQITGLLELGHDVQIFASYNPKEGCVHRDVEKYRLMERAHYDPQIPQNRVLSLLKAVRVVISLLLCHPVLLARTFFLLYRQRVLSLRWLFRFCRFFGERFDIVHAHFGPSGIHALYLQQIGIRGKYITTFHGYDVSKYIREKGKDVYRELFKRQDLFTYNSDATKQKLLGLNCPPEKLIKVPMGVNLERMPFAERRVRGGEPVNILSVGRLVEMKGREYAIRAVASVRTRFPEIIYNIVGDGPLRQSLQHLINDLGVSNSVHVLGWVSSEQLDSLYQSSHIFLHPSVTASDGNMEGQGVVLLEAQAYGLPVVATMHGAFPESVLDGKSAFLVPERDVDALTERLEYLLGHPELWAQMGRWGRRFVEENYDLRKLNRQLADVYQALLLGSLGIKTACRAPRQAVY
jgi:colanic acid/amylovoran biosynthesis glycosyltransferase